MIRKLLSVVVVIVVFVSIAQARNVKIQIEGSMDNIINLIEHLNKNGKSHDISFTIDEEEYEFRILTSGGGVGFKEQFFHGGRKKAEAVVMTPDCELLFIVARGSRITKGGAYNAVSKEIAKQLGKYLKALDKIHGASNQSDSGC